MNDNRQKPVVLCILDGWAIGDGGEYDAIASANTPHWDRISGENPSTTLTTFGLDVGLPEGQMGNSEVGHMNIGAGRVVMQFLPRIDKAFKEDSVKDNEALGDLIAKLKENGGTCHLMGLVSDGGVHAHLDHINKLAAIVAAAGVPVALHAFMDGRDTPPQSGAAYMAQMVESDLVKVATVSGRYYAMDRDKRWERVELAYKAMAQGQGESAETAAQAIEASYANDVSDEFILPTAIGDYRGMKDGDGILFANFRSDRAREILTALVDDSFDGFAVQKFSFSAVAGMVPYSDLLDPLMSALFPAQKLNNILGQVVSEAGLTQLRLAETEKYPHVTFFFNAGVETPYEGEERILIPSPKVATYDLQPEMSEAGVTDALLGAIESEKFDLIIVNYANTDMVGHTGSIEAARAAAEAVDGAIGKVEALVKEKGGVLILTADHGNADQMWDPKTNGPHTAHTLNPVPCILVGNGAVDLRVGRLADLSPTVLALLGVEQPAEMDGHNLII